VEIKEDDDSIDESATIAEISMYTLQFGFFATYSVTSCFIRNNYYECSADDDDYYIHHSVDSNHTDLDCVWCNGPITTTRLPNHTDSSEFY